MKLSRCYTAPFRNGELARSPKLLNMMLSTIENAVTKIISHNILEYDADPVNSYLVNYEVTNTIENENKNVDDI